MKFTEAIHFAPPEKFEIRVQQTQANKTLSQYLHALIDFPEYLLARYQLLPTKKQRSLINEFKFQKYGMVAWLAHFWFNRGRTTPDNLKNTCLLSYKIDAKLSDALLKLSEATFELSDSLNEFDFEGIEQNDKPGWLWFMCEMGNWLILLEDSRLGLDLGIPDLSNPIPLIGKVEAINGLKDFIDRLEGIIPTETINSNQFDVDSIDPWLAPLNLLLSEAEQIAKINDDFEVDYWQPYLKLMRQWKNKARKDPYTQFTYLLKDGSERTTGKHYKLPTEVKLL